MDIRVRLDEIVPSKTVARDLPNTLNRLQTGDVDQFVITRRSVPTAVLLTVDRYQELLRLSAEDPTLPST